MESILAPYSESVTKAFFLFPILALVLTIPYLIHQYKKYGAVPFWRNIVVYSFVLYLLNVYFLVILPLPSRDAVVALTTDRYNIQPFRFMELIATTTDFSLTRPSTWWDTLKSPHCYTVLLNILLFFPLGIYLRYYFKRGFFSTVALCFLASLFCELTQLTGLYGIYPRPYRLFDVDDLMVNTFGGMLGFCLAPVFSIFLPSRDKIDRRAYEKGDAVPLLRRVLAAAIDWILPFLLLWSAEKLLPEDVVSSSGYRLTVTVLVVLYFSLLLYCCKGQTPGKRFFHTSIQSFSGNRPSFLQCLLRYTLLYGVLLQLFDWSVAAFIKAMDAVVGIDWGPFLASLLLGGLALAFFVELLLRFLGITKHLLYERISGTCHQNLIGKQATTTPQKRPKKKRKHKPQQPNRVVYQQTELSADDVPARSTPARNSTPRTPSNATGKPIAKPPAKKAVVNPPQSTPKKQKKRVVRGKKSTAKQP